MTTQTSRSPVAALVLGVAVPLALWAAVIAGLLIVVPGYKKKYQEFGMSLPDTTRAAFDVANWANTYWYVLLIWLVLFLPAGTLIAVALGRRHVPFLSRLWIGAMIVLPLLAGILLAVAIYAAETRLLEGLSR